MLACPCASLFACACTTQARVVTAIVLTGSVWVLAQNAPDINTLKEEGKAAHDSLLKYIVGACAHSESICGHVRFEESIKT